MSKLGEVDSANEADRQKWRAFAAIAIAFFTMVMTMSMVFVALSSIADDFGVTLRAVSWVVIVEALIISALMLPMGRLADMVGRKRIHLTGLVIFGTGAVLTALAPTFPLLIAARVVMATGNAMGQSVGTAMVVAVFPTHERGKAVGSMTTAVSIGGASGPIVAGLMLQVLPWESLFLMLAIPVSIAFVAAQRLLDEETVSRGARSDSTQFDWGGAFISGLLVVVLVLTINNPLAVSWASPLIISGALFAAALLGIFITWESRAEHPMLELQHFANATFSMAVATRALGFMAASATRFLLPVYLISLRGLSEGAAGSVLFLISLGMGISAQTSGRLSDRLGTRPFAVGGVLLMLATSIFLSSFTQTTGMATITVVVFMQGLAHGLWNVPNSSTILGSVPASSLGVIGAFINLTRNVGNVVGQAVASAVVVGVMVSRGFDIPLSEIAETPGAGAAFTAGWRTAYLVAAAAVSLALLLALLTRQATDADSE